MNYEREVFGLGLWWCVYAYVFGVFIVWCLNFVSFEWWSNVPCLNLGIFQISNNNYCCVDSDFHCMDVMIMICFNPLSVHQPSAFRILQTFINYQQPKSLTLCTMHSSPIVFNGFYETIFSNVRMLGVWVLKMIIIIFLLLLSFLEWKIIIENHPLLIRIPYTVYEVRWNGFKYLDLGENVLNDINHGTKSMTYTCNMYVCIFGTGNSKEKKAIAIHLLLYSKGKMVVTQNKNLLMADGWW